MRPTARIVASMSSSPPDPSAEPRAADDPALHPAPAGFTLSRATHGDLGDVTELYRRAELDLSGEVTIRPEDIRYRWLDGGLDDTLLIRDDTGDLVAYAEFHEDTDPWTDELDLYLDARVHPDRTGEGLATFILTRAEERARLAARRRGDDHAILRTTVVDLDARALAWHERRGFRFVRHFLQMRLDLTAAPPAPVWPEDVTLAAVDRAGLRAVWQTHQAAFADVPTHLPLTYEEFVDQRIDRDPDHDLSLWWAAMAGDVVVGVLVGRATTPEGAESGYIRDLAVLPGWRRSGVGMALLRTALTAFWERGLTGVALEVDDVSLDGATALYEAAGMQIVRRRDVVELDVHVQP